MLRDVAEGLLVETKAFRWVMRALLVLFVFGITAPLFWVLSYFGTRAAQGQCEALKPGLESQTLTTGQPVPELDCSTIKVKLGN